MPDADAVAQCEKREESNMRRSTGITRLLRYLEEESPLTDDFIWHLLFVQVARDILQNPVFIGWALDLPVRCLSRTVDSYTDAFSEARYYNPWFYGKMGPTEEQLAEFTTCPFTRLQIRPATVHPDVLNGLNRLWDKWITFDDGPDAESHCPLYSRSMAYLWDLFLHFHFAGIDHSYETKFQQILANRQNRTGMKILHAIVRWNRVVEDRKEPPIWDCYPKEIKQWILVEAARHFTEMNADTYGWHCKQSVAECIIEDDLDEKILDKMPEEYRKIHTMMVCGVNRGVVYICRELLAQAPVTKEKIAERLAPIPDEIPKFTMALKKLGAVV